MHTHRWEVWGRHCASQADGTPSFEREQHLAVVRTDNRDAALAELKHEFGSKWELWLESFPFLHPHRALQKRLEERARREHCKAGAIV